MAQTHHATSPDVELRRLEQSLLGVASLARFSWIGDILMATLGGASVFYGYREAKAAGHPGHTELFWLGVFLLAVTVASEFEGMFWRRVRRYILLRQATDASVVSAPPGDRTRVSPLHPD